MDFIKEGNVEKNTNIKLNWEVKYLESFLILSFLYVMY